MAFSPTFLQQQKERLLTEKQRLEDELGRIARPRSQVAGDYDATFPDFGRNEEENAQEEERYVTRLGVEGSLETHLQEVDRALGRIDNGTYGVCARCGKEISVERLNAFPAATTCIEHTT